MTSFQNMFVLNLVQTKKWKSYTNIISDFTKWKNDLKYG